MHDFCRLLLKDAQQGAIDHKVSMGRITVTRHAIGTNKQFFCECEGYTSRWVNGNMVDCVASAKAEYINGIVGE